ncbi:MAG: hypothetical protein F6J97_13475 [Leptolyngbya sp. SIO4C1]|nr:hypothetical protein [Leptolyngbya sp. SIO4C1]
MNLSGFSECDFASFSIFSKPSAIQAALTHYGRSTARNENQHLPKMNMKVLISNFRKLDGFLILAIAIVILGGFFRFYGLESKYYWSDEVYTSIRVFGLSAEALLNHFYTGEIISPHDLSNYIEEQASTSLLPTILGLAKEEPQHPPLFFLLAKLWSSNFSSSVTGIRSMSAAFSLLNIGLIFWLTRLLFRSRTVSLSAVSLAAVSPFYVLYAQEARPYSFWTAIVLVSCILLLYANRTKQLKFWIGYACALALGLYTFFLSLALSISHGLYLTYHLFSKNRCAFKQYAQASLFSILIFTPWIITTVFYRDSAIAATSWTQNRTPLWNGNESLIKSWFFNFGRLFLDFNTHIDHPITVALTFSTVIIYLLSLLYLVKQKSAPSQAAFVISLTAFPFLAIAMYDITQESQISTTQRYFMPACLGVQLSISYFIGRCISSRFWLSKKLGKLLLTYLILLGVAYNYLIISADTWWNKSEVLPRIADFLNSQDKSVLIVLKRRDGSFDTLGNVLSLSPYLDDNVNLLLQQGTYLTNIQNGYKHAYILDMSPDLEPIIKSRYSVRTVPGFQSRLDEISLHKLKQNELKQRQPASKTSTQS